MTAKLPKGSKVTWLALQRHPAWAQAGLATLEGEGPKYFHLRYQRMVEGKLRVHEWVDKVDRNKVRVLKGHRHTLVADLVAYRQASEDHRRAKEAAHNRSEATERSLAYSRVREAMNEWALKNPEPAVPSALQE